MKEKIWKLARAIARSEERLDFFTSKFREELEVTEEEVRLLQEKFNIILQYEDAEEILAALPIAKEFVAKEKDRQKAIENNTFLGKFDTLIEHWTVCLDDEIDVLPSLDSAQEIGLDEDEQEVWKTLESAIQEGQKKELLEALRDFSSLVKAQLIFANLPDPPELPDLEE